MAGKKTIRRTRMSLGHQGRDTAKGKKREPSSAEPESFRTATFNFQQIQVERTLAEDEVQEINLIIKERALRTSLRPSVTGSFPRQR